MNIFKVCASRTKVLGASDVMGEGLRRTILGLHP
jgi:hypothetical protein